MKLLNRPQRGEPLHANHIIRLVVVKLPEKEHKKYTKGSNTLLGLYTLLQCAIVTGEITGSHQHRPQ
jgi:hypothetical protein